MPAVKTVGIFAKPKAPAATHLIPELLTWLATRGIAVRLDEVAATYALGATGLPRPNVPDGCELAIVLGAATAPCYPAAQSVASRALSLLAVNLGGLAFWPRSLPGSSFRNWNAR